MTPDEFQSELMELLRRLVEALEALAGREPS